MRQLVISTALLAASAAIFPSCGGPTITSDPKLLNPTETRGLAGGTDDIYDATQQAINSLVSSDGLRAHLEAKKGNRVVLNSIVNQTGIPEYDEKIIYNRFLGDLINNAGGRLAFLNRSSVKKERELQQTGQVKTSGVPALTAGADLVLDIELRQLPSARTKTIQYNFSLTDLEGILVWSKPIEIMKAR